MKIRKVKKETVVVTIPISKEDVTKEMIDTLESAIEAKRSLQDAQEALEIALQELVDVLDVNKELDADSLPDEASAEAVMDLWEDCGVIEDDN